ncbi:DUF2125 domain-containing protein [Hansschlegelia beijingensis]|uniref:DUF2125 domain-containing protein n=1 Tax=Hansschlegelia beijingensis TaxID=1133344 RepID=A0A7W6D475_9HYPH|nr:DUF2125 domain-containing protein [Hansschlegelia beijingensis]MBB3973980.1 hypothetical protein [Hansschlegelia beijingensis]
MSQSDPAVDPVPPQPPRSRWPIFLPFTLLLIGAAAWSGFWFYAARQADDAIADALRREAAHGRIYACADRRIVGFPFRVEMICDRLTVTVPADGGPVVATAPKFMAVAQVYDPKRLIGELTGPVQITDGAGGRSELSFALAQASMMIADKRLERTSIVLTEPRLSAGDDEFVAAKELQVHVRRAPGQKPEGTYDFAVKLDQATSPLLDLVPIGSGPVFVEIQAEARGLDDLRPRPTSERLRDFAAAGGRVHVALARIARGEVAAEARGDLGLDAEGRISGGGDVVARGVDSLVKSLLGEGKKTGLASLLGIGAQMLGAPAELNGAPATSYRVRIDRGKVEIGPIRVYKLPPVF